MSVFQRGQAGPQPTTFQKRVEIIVAVVACLTIALVYSATHWIAPTLFSHFEHAPELASLPKRTVTAHHAKGDPINIAIRASDIAIAKSVLLDRPDSTAPISHLYLFGRVQDFAFEREVGKSARSRHHVRFWLAEGTTHDKRPVWLGDATFDVRAGVTSTLLPTHHIGPDVDQERDTLVANLVAAKQVDTVFTVSGMGVRVVSHNGEGDRFDTDGEMDVVILSPHGAASAHPDTLAEPSIVATKDRIWNWFHTR
jgi:hypothetical protein